MGGPAGPLSAGRGAFGLDTKFAPGPASASGSLWTDLILLKVLGEAVARNVADSSVDNFLLYLGSCGRGRIKFVRALLYDFFGPRGSFGASLYWFSSRHFNELGLTFALFCRDFFSSI